MAYTLQAIIGDAAMLRTGCPTGAKVVDLAQGKAMIPLCGDLLEETEIPYLPLTDGGDEELCEPINEFASRFKGRGQFAYVEAEFFGGTGTQACVTWDANGVASAPLVDQCAINTALKFLGIIIGDFHDEFDALGLGSHRNTEEWKPEE